MTSYIVTYIEHGEVKRTIIKDCFTSLQAVMRFRDKYGNLEIVSCTEDAFNFLKDFPF